MKFKKSLFVLAPVFATLLITSCGDVKKPSTDESEDPDEGLIVNPDPIMKEKVTITLKTTAGQQSRPILERMKKYFYYEEPNITVNIEYPGGGYPGISKQTLEEFQTNKHGDLVMIYPDVIAECLAQGYCYDLDPYITNEEYGIVDDYSDYIETYMQEGANYLVAGTYSMPFSKSTEVMYYDSAKLIGKSFEGINDGHPLLPTYFDTMTWEKLFTEFCPNIIKHAKKTPGFLDMPDNKPWSVVGIDSDSNLFITLAKQYGLPYTSVDKVNGTFSYDFYEKGDADNAMLEKIYEYSGYAQKHYLMSQAQIADRPNNFFKTNNCLLSIASTAGMSYHFDTANPKNLYVSRIPQAEGKPEASISQGPSMAFLRHRNEAGEWDENRQLASWLFYRYMTTAANAADWAINAKYMPIRNSIYETAAYKKASDPSQVRNQKSELALLARINELIPKHEGTYFTSEAFPGSRNCRDQVGALVGKCFSLKGADLTKNKVVALFDEYLNKVKLGH